jgi:hypothetical protein
LHYRFARRTGNHRSNNQGPHRQADEEELGRLQPLAPPQRWALIEKACELAAAINRSRIAAVLPPAEPASWPQSTWEFMR